MADLGRLAWERPLVAELGILALEHPLAPHDLAFKFVGDLTSGAICCPPNKRDLLQSADRRLNLIPCLPLLTEGALLLLLLSTSRPP